MVTVEGVSCARCGKVSPARSLVAVRGVWIGPGCIQVLRRREKMRAEGKNPRVVRDAETGWAHGVSGNATACPDDADHCLACIHLRRARCPMEVFVAGDGDLSEG